MVSSVARLVVRERADGRCEYCRAPEVITGSTYHIEHIAPTARGGGDDPGNLALACITCNGHKSAAISGMDPQTGLMEPLFDPRRDDWDSEFLFVPATLNVVGRTAKGRATVARLQMNERKQIEARELWLELELYP